jgi:hypothetical protein
MRFIILRYLSVSVRMINLNIGLYLSNITPTCSSVSIVTRLRAGRAGSIYGTENGYFSLRHQVHTASGAHPASNYVCNWALSPEVKRPGREAGYSSPSSPEVNAWSYTRTPLYAFLAWFLIEQRIHLHGLVPRKGKLCLKLKYEGVSESFRTGRLERELHMVQLSATRCSCVAIFWFSLVSFAAIALCVASQRVFVVDVVHFVIDSVRKLLDTPPYNVIDFLEKERPRLAVWSWYRTWNVPSIKVYNFCL